MKSLNKVSDNGEMNVAKIHTDLKRPSILQIAECFVRNCVERSRTTGLDANVISAIVADIASENDLTRSYVADSILYLNDNSRTRRNRQFVGAFNRFKEYLKPLVRERAKQSRMNLLSALADLPDDFTTSKSERESTFETLARRDNPDMEIW